MSEIGVLVGVLFKFASVLDPGVWVKLVLHDKCVTGITDVFLIKQLLVQDVLIVLHDRFFDLKFVPRCVFFHFVQTYTGLFCRLMPDV